MTRAILDTALAAGVDRRFGERVVDLIGSGTDEEPVAGVRLESGEEIRAPWVFGADGRGSTVTGRLGIEKTRPLGGEVAYLLAYWDGLPATGYATSDIRTDEVVNRWTADDGLHLLTAWGDAESAGSPRRSPRRSSSGRRWSAISSSRPSP